MSFCISAAADVVPSFVSSLVAISLSILGTSLCRSSSTTHGIYLSSMWIRHPSILGRHSFWLNHSVVVSGCGWTVNRKEEQIGLWWRPHNSRNNISLINYILLTSNGTHLLMITKHNITLHYGVWVDTRAGHDVGDEKRWDRILNHNSSTKGNSTNFHQQTQGRMLSFWERGKWNYCHVRRKKEKYHHHWWKGR